MKRSFLSIILPVLILTIILAGCGGIPSLTPAATLTQEAVTPTISTTPDPCLPPHIEAEVRKVQKHMREFDDASTLASNLLQMQQGQLSNSVADLQRIRREAEDEQVPACLTNLKAYQVEHMNTVINILLAFMSISDPRTLEDRCTTIESTQEQTICQGSALAGQQHDQYILEIARVLGLTVVPATEAVDRTPSETPTP